MDRYLEIINNITDNKMKAVHEFITNNIGSEAYNIARSHVVDFYPKLVIDFDSMPEYIIKMAWKDLSLFSEAEKKRAEKVSISVGDYILRKDGKVSQVGIFLTPDKVQDTWGGSFHITKHGNGDYSGGFTMDTINVKSLVFTGDYKPFSCWIFSGHMAGGNRGVHSAIKAKVWAEQG